MATLGTPSARSFSQSTTLLASSAETSSPPALW